MMDNWISSNLKIQHLEYDYWSLMDGKKIWSTDLKIYCGDSFCLPVKGICSTSLAKGTYMLLSITQGLYLNIENLWWAKLDFVQFPKILGGIFN